MNLGDRTGNQRHLSRTPKTLSLPRARDTRDHCLQGDVFTNGRRTQWSACWAGRKAEGQGLFRAGGGQMAAGPGPEESLCWRRVEECLRRMDVRGEARPLCLTGMDECGALVVMWRLRLSGGSERNLKCKRVM